PPRQKFKALRRLIESHDVANALIFCNRKREVASLRRQMERVGFSVRDIHGDLDQAQRTAALDAFKRGEIAYLVATDVAARGLDIAMLPCVINYDVPTHADDYVHRIGRTGRAGQEGRAFTLVLPDERRYVDAIAKLTGKEIPRLEIAGMQPEVAAEESGGPARRGRTPRAAARDVTAAKSFAAAAPSAGAAPAEASEAAAAPTEAARTPAEALPDGAARPRGRSGRRSRRSGTRAEAAPAAAPEAAPPPPRQRGRGVAAEPEAAPSPARRRDRGGGPPPERKPVVGMGDHVPLFMRRPVPQLAPLPESAED
ncbi:MAG TPA: C-terminal helicase domain-containing protein, partial [Geminicoccaceae bacterium]|nr:C-terminal helicase domain-containing protein [Geminicoccaceae bacterium]